jgi:hypothetical protein
VVQGQPREIVHETPSPKITRAKWTGGVAQEVKLLLCQCEALEFKHQFQPRKKILLPYP